jgi:uncharacterized protein with FMN-binding domain
MRKITMWFVTTVAVMVLLFSYRTSTMGTAPSGASAAAANPPGVVTGVTPGQAATDGSNTGGSTSGGSTNSGSNTGGSTNSGSNTGGSTNSGSTNSGSATLVNGTVAQTRWGPVQVQVHIGGGRITDVTALQVPSGNRRDAEINAYAVPQLRTEALAAQSAQIDVVSGATVTSEGYMESLQAALDSAHFKG